MKPQVIKYRIKEKSFIAKIAAANLGSDNVAMVIGRTIYLHNVSRKDFLRDKRWLAHEQAHLKQYKDHGTVSFLWKYLIESIKNGYYENKFEVEAREAEQKF